VVFYKLLSKALLTKVVDTWEKETSIKVFHFALI